MRSFNIALFLCLLFIVEVEAGSPVREISRVLFQGPNLVSIEVNPFSTGDVFTEDDLQKLSGASFVGTLESDKMGRSRWRTYLHGRGFAPRSIVGGEAYLIWMKQEGTMHYRGLPWAKRYLQRSLRPGLNTIALPRRIPAGYTLRQLCEKVGASVIWKTVAGKFSPYYPSGPIPDEALNEADGYLVNVSTAYVATLPDGMAPSRLLFASDRGAEVGVYVGNEDGSNQWAQTNGCFSTAPIFGPKPGWFSFTSSRISADSTTCGNGMGLYTQEFATGRRETNIAFSDGEAIIRVRDLPDDSGVLLEKGPVPGLGQIFLYLFSYASGVVVRVAPQADLEQGAVAAVDVLGEGTVIYYSARDNSGWSIWRQRLGSTERTRITTPSEVLVAPSPTWDDKWLYATKYNLVPKTTGAIVLGSGELYRFRSDGTGAREPVFVHADSDETASAFTPDGEGVYVISTAAEAGGAYNIFLLDLASKSFTPLTTGTNSNTPVRVGYKSKITAHDHCPIHGLPTVSLDGH